MDNLGLSPLREPPPSTPPSQQPSSSDESFSTSRIGKTQRADEKLGLDDDPVKRLGATQAVREVKQNTFQKLFSGIKSGKALGATGGSIYRTKLDEAVSKLLILYKSEGKNLSKSDVKIIKDELKETLKGQKTGVAPGRQKKARYRRKLYKQQKRFIGKKGLSREDFKDALKIGEAIFKAQDVETKIKAGKTAQEYLDEIKSKPTGQKSQAQSTASQATQPDNVLQFKPNIPQSPSANIDENIDSPETESVASSQSQVSSNIDENIAEGDSDIEEENIRRIQAIQAKDDVTKNWQDQIDDPDIDGDIQKAA